MGFDRKVFAAVIVHFGVPRENHDFFCHFRHNFFGKFLKKISRACPRRTLCELLKTHLFSGNGGVGKKLAGGKHLTGRYVRPLFGPSRGLNLPVS